MIQFITWRFILKEPPHFHFIHFTVCYNTTYCLLAKPSNFIIKPFQLICCGKRDLLILGIPDVSMIINSKKFICQMILKPHYDFYTGIIPNIDRKYFNKDVMRIKIT